MPDEKCEAKKLQYNELRDFFLNNAHSSEKREPILPLREVLEERINNTVCLKNIVNLAIEKNITIELRSMDIPPKIETITTIKRAKSLTNPELQNIVLYITLTSEIQSE